MIALIFGLVLFLGLHSVRTVAPQWRERQITRLGVNGWKGIYSLISIAGFVLIVYGFGQSRANPVMLWYPPVGMRHLASLLTLFAFIFLVAAYVPRNAIKAKLKHPMILGVKIWALAHLLANGTLADVILFGAFLLWAVFDFRSARRRQPVVNVGGTSAVATIATVIVGIVIWAAFAFYLHEVLIGVRPVG